MKIVIGNDHSAVHMREVIAAYLREEGYEVEEIGTFSTESSHYPEWVCGTGVGISIACNKVKGIRACCCSEPYTSKLSRQHNNSNVLCFGARVVGEELAKMIVSEWLNAEYLGGRHQIRVDMISDVESRQ